MEYVGEGGLNDIRNRIYKRRGQAVLNSTGQATISFSPPIIMDREPYLQLTPRIASGANPVIANIVDGTFTQSGGAYTGVTIQGQRAQDLPGGLTAINIVVSLNGRKVVEKDSLNGVKVDWLAT